MNLNRFILFCSFSITATVVTAYDSKYKGDKLVSIDLPTRQSREKIAGYYKNHSKVEVWSQGNTECEVQIKSNDLKELQEFCGRENISMTVLLDDVEATIQNEARLNNLELKTKKFNYNRYNRYHEILLELNNLRCGIYSNLIKVVTYGYSYEGRPLTLVKISQHMSKTLIDNKPIVWIDGGIHGREWITVATVMNLMKKLLEGYGTNAQITKLLDEHTFYFVPVVNPDGYEYSHQHDRLWRKTRTITQDPACIGADPNRNFDIKWNEGGASTNPCDNDYRGPQPNSEPCVSSYSNLLTNKKSLLKAYWNLHSFFQVLYIPNGYTYAFPTDLLDIMQVALKFVSSVKKRNKTPYSIFQAPYATDGIVTGASIDFVHSVLGISFSYSVELPPQTSSPGMSGFILGPSHIEPITLETMDAILDCTEKIDEVVNKKKGWSM